eukprot:TRINITY_DN76537_c0_g1_i1.p1 TRINITY_DN76537_c0_g1~~TRINITY_DN76537_c0_g1_i1.p1  ORF type:complete len:508 (-),score=108.47 TRINITY_DN76537_c0_g1_i1:369-1892(-)
MDTLGLLDSCIRPPCCINESNDGALAETPRGRNPLCEYGEFFSAYGEFARPLASDRLHHYEDCVTDFGETVPSRMVPAVAESPPGCYTRQAAPALRKRELPGSNLQRETSGIGHQRLCCTGTADSPPGWNARQSAPALRKGELPGTRPQRDTSGIGDQRQCSTGSTDSCQYRITNGIFEGAQAAPFAAAGWQDDGVCEIRDSARCIPPFRQLSELVAEELQHYQRVSSGMSGSQSLRVDFHHSGASMASMSTGTADLDTCGTEAEPPFDCIREELTEVRSRLAETEERVKTLQGELTLQAELTDVRQAVYEDMEETVNGLQMELERARSEAEGQARRAEQMRAASQQLCELLQQECEEKAAACDRTATLAQEVARLREAITAQEVATIESRSPGGRSAGAVLGVKSSTPTAATSAQLEQETLLSFRRAFSAPSAAQSTCEQKAQMDGYEDGQHEKAGWDNIDTAAAETERLRKQLAASKALAAESFEELIRAELAAEAMPEDDEDAA